MYSLLKNRRSIRRYKEEKISEGAVEILLKSILRSPSGKNINPWEVIYIDNKETISKLSVSKAKGGKFLAGAPQCLLILVDETKTDIWIEDAAIATTIAHLTAESLGLGSCWIQIRNRLTSEGVDSEEYVRELMDLPSNIRVEAIIAFGYPDEEKKPHSEEGLQLDKIFRNEYGKNYF
ncbi:nitroreductase family protein [Wukongibacter baidiensis]|uniref:nitroreductase family protein n=1 Tax=Wukongibacter baidiensis TaxID=1723361 RepID=UPI003D7F8002